MMQVARDGGRPGRLRHHCLSALSLGATVALLAACGLWRDSADAADDSCLSSVSSQLQGGWFLAPEANSHAWREWSADETDGFLARLDPQSLDCRGGLRKGPDLSRELRIRTHLKGQNVEFELWLASRPHVRCCLQ